MRKLSLPKITLPLAISAACCLALTFAVKAPAEETPATEPSIGMRSSISIQGKEEIALTGFADFCCGETGGDCQTGNCNLNGTQAVCSPKRVEKDVKKHSWQVESKLVCIPGFRWPWERVTNRGPDCGNGCDRGADFRRLSCGKIRRVNVLEKHTYTCKKCSYEWEVKCVRSACKTRGGGQPSCPSCDR